MASIQFKDFCLDEATRTATAICIKGISTLQHLMSPDVLILTCSAGSRSWDGHGFKLASIDGNKVKLWYLGY